MPLHDFWCARCGQLLLDIYVPVALTASAGAPTHCGARMAWVPAAPALHYGDVKGAAFRSFDTTDGRGQPVHIDSLRKLRQVERESEQMARDGVGQPMVWRRYAQDPSNRDQPTLSPDYRGPSQSPTPAAAHRFGSTLQKTVEAPDHRFGPGVSEANASALPMSGKE
jgi:hypothetical protein